MEEGKILIASFDIGKKNFAFCIEETDEKLLSCLDVIPKSKRHEKNGEPSLAFGEVLQKVCSNGKIILVKNCDLTKGVKSSTKYLDVDVFHNLYELLNEHEEYFNKCSFFIIEQQMSFGTKHNTMALKIGQHCFSYFIFKYGKTKTAIEFPSYHKTQVLGAKKVESVNKKGITTYKALDKPGRKKWSVVKAMDILTERNDTENIPTLSSSKKKDDLADVVCQLQAFKYLFFVDKQTF